MIARSTHNGRDVIYENDKWVYEDTKEPIVIDNPFAPIYKELTDEQKNTVNRIKERAMTLYEEMRTSSGIDPRCMSVAKTKLEEAVMWAVKGVTNPPKKDE